MKLKIMLILFFTIFEIVLADTQNNQFFDGENLGFGSGKHFFGKVQFDDKSEYRVITKLTKGANHYELELSKSHFMHLKTTQESGERISIKFKLKQYSDVYLVDIYDDDKNNIIIALSESPYGYKIIKFRPKNNSYVPYLYADFNYVPGLMGADPHRVKKVGFDAKGNFSIKLDNDSVDTYTINDDKAFVLRNGERHKVSFVEKFDNELPKHLKIE